MSLADVLAHYLADHPLVATAAALALVLTLGWLALAAWGVAADVFGWALRGIAHRWPRLAYLAVLVDGHPIPDLPDDVRQHQLDHLTLTLVDTDAGLVRGRSGTWWSTAGPLPHATSRNLDALADRGWVETLATDPDREHVAVGLCPRTAELTEAGVRALHALACDDPRAHLELTLAAEPAPARPDTTLA